MKAEELFKELNPITKSLTSFVCLTGSHNYHLEDENSDYDFKLFVYPTFKDLYNGDKKNSRDTKICDQDLKTTDIRFFKSTLEKSNINFLEVLYSEDIFIPTKENEELDKANKQMIAVLQKNREMFAAMNIHYLIKAVKGSVCSRMKQFKNGNYKAASQAFKETLMLGRYLTNLYKGEEDPFLNAIKFKKEDAMRSIYFDIRNKVISDDKIMKSLALVEQDMDSIIQKGNFDSREKDLMACNLLEMTLEKSVTTRIQVELNGRCK